MRQGGGSTRLDRERAAPGRSVWGPAPGGALTSRPAWILGLALILSIWLASTYDAWRRREQAAAQAARIHAEFLRAEDLLASIRQSLFLSSIALRDGLLEAGPARMVKYRDVLVANRHAIQKAVAEYGRLARPAGDDEAMLRLRQELDRRWADLLPLLDEAALRGTERARARLREFVMPRREIILALLQQVQAISRDSFARQEAEVAALYRAADRRAWMGSTVALALSIFVAFVVARYGAGLEARIRQQVVEHAQTARDLQRLSARLVRVQEDERRAFARELHDEVGQALTAVKAELAVVARRLAGSGVPEEVLSDARAVADDALKAVRDLSQLLHPTVLDDLGLPAAVGALLRSVGPRAGLRTELVHQGLSGRLASEVEVCAYRIVQEGLTNVVRHAGAGEVRVTLDRSDSWLRVSVEDDGRGFEWPASLSRSMGGLGLLGIRERVTGLGGRVWLDSAPGRGTRLVAELPALGRVEPDEGQ